MDPRIDFLTGTPFARIAGAFNEAFADYYLQMGQRAEVWLRNRMIKNAVDLECSVGVFDGENLVGFSLTGVGMWQDAPAAFDAATGIVRAHRGQGLARKMFDFALPRLRERGVERFLLEVLQVNEPAIKAYRNTGFHITREFDCFELDRAAADAPGETSSVPASAMRTRPVLDCIVRPIPKERTEDLADQFDWTPSWENSVASIRRIPDDVLAFGAYERDLLVGTIVYYPLLNWVMNLTIRREVRRRGIGTQLLAHLLANIPEGVPRVRIVNVAHEDGGAIAFLESRGFRKFTSQYEMEMKLV